MLNNPIRWKKMENWLINQLISLNINFFFERLALITLLFSLQINTPYQYHAWHGIGIYGKLRVRSMSLCKCRPHTPGPVFTKVFKQECCSRKAKANGLGSSKNLASAIFPIHKSAQAEILLEPYTYSSGSSWKHVSKICIIFNQFFERIKFKIYTKFSDICFM